MYQIENISYSEYLRNENAQCVDKKHLILVFMCCGKQECFSLEVVQSKKKKTVHLNNMVDHC